MLMTLLKIYRWHLKKCSYVLLFCIIFFCNPIVSAQTVGLVLSGGGAKGAAHIGVIRALEEAEVPIDYITGTSMGAIIGGLYAAGYTPDEMEALINSRDFSYWSTGKIDPKYSYYFKVPAKNASWIDFKFNFDTILKPAIPTNLVSPISMDFAFMELFGAASAAANYDFDNLMVPFKCIASDIAGAKAVVLEKGDLGQAIRASMTYPFIFRPIVIDSVLLFDGGMYNNFPSDVMFDRFFPDIIIGSQVSANAKAPDIDNIVTQLQSMLMMKSDFNVFCDNSILIKPDIPQVGTVDFSQNHVIVDSGYKAAIRAIPEIRSFLLRRRSQHSLDSLRKSFNDRKPEYNIGTITINGLSKKQTQYMQNMLRNVRPEAGDINMNSESRFHLKEIKPQYFRFASEGKSDHMYPAIRYNALSSVYDLRIDIQKRNQLITEIGGAITSSSVNELFLQWKYLFWTRKSLELTANSYFGRFYNSALFSFRYDLPKYNPYSLTAGFVFNKFNYFKTNTFFYADEDPFYLVIQDRFGFLTSSFPFRNHGKIEVDLSFGKTLDKYYQTNIYKRDDILDKTTFSFIAPSVIFDINTLNYKEYPNSGIQLKMGIDFIDGKEKFFPGTTAFDSIKTTQKHSWFKFHFLYENYFTSYKRVKFGSLIQLNYSTSKEFSNYTSTLLSINAFQPVSESNIRFIPAFRASKFMAAGSKNVFIINKNFDYRLEGYLFMVQDALRMNTLTGKTEYSNQILFYPMASTAFVYRTPLGPISINLNYFSAEVNPLSFFVKFGYLIFNRRPY